MEITLSTTGTWKDLVLLSARHVRMGGSLSREVLESEVSVLGGVEIHCWRHCCCGSIFLERLF